MRPTTGQIDAPRSTQPINPGRFARIGGISARLARRRATPGRDRSGFQHDKMALSIVSLADGSVIELWSH